MDLADFTELAFLADLATPGLSKIDVNHLNI